MDVTTLQVMPLDLLECLYADDGYTCYDVEDLLRGCVGVELRTCRKSNSKRADEPHIDFL
ncbi:hypothetical protein [Pontibacter harenae]|uniref:hypothetical protein n=1 Tax=Pontibacter harenae TaxID=2894083 RepID=UPI001E2DF8B4|nr:hypothetical protein [Pontibacter harenae]MCC9168537.1 hypothetical protein [Pontibacter harenae]